jgi:hypothetical protein
VFETAVSNAGPDLQDSMSVKRRPAHLTLFVHAGINETIDGTLIEGLFWTT